MTAPRKALSALDAATVGLALIVGGLGVWTVFAGPAELLPVHWNASGEADDWGTREVVGGVLIGMALLTLLLGGGMGVAARRADDPARARALRYAQLVVILSLPLVSLLAASASLSGTTDIGGAVPVALMSLLFLLIGAFLGRVGPNPFVGVRTPWAYKSRLAWDRSNRLAGRLFFVIGLAGLLFLLIGAFLGRVGPNPFVGVRTPWAYKSRLAWDRSNRLAGRLFFVIGLAGLLTAPFAPRPFNLYALLVAIGLAAVWSIVESWRVWRTDPDRQPF